MPSQNTIYGSRLPLLAVKQRSGRGWGVFFTLTGSSLEAHKGNTRAWCSVACYACWSAVWSEHLVFLQRWYLYCIISVEKSQCCALTAFSIACPWSGRSPFNSFSRMTELKLVSLSLGCGIFCKIHSQLKPLSHREEQTAGGLTLWSRQIPGSWSQLQRTFQCLIPHRILQPISQPLLDNT